MYGPFSHSFKKIAAAAVLSFCVAGGVSAVTIASVREGAPTVAVSVNRINKGDRLPQSSILSGYPNDRPHAGRASSSPKRPPLGCDPAFSPVSAPELAHIFKRCLA